MDGNELHELCNGNNPTLAEITDILARNPEAANEKSEDGSYPLHYLCKNEKITVEVLSAFLERAPGAANETDLGGEYPLYYLSKNQSSTLEMRSILEAASPFHALCGVDYITAEALSALLERAPGAANEKNKTG